VSAERISAHHYIHVGRFNMLSNERQEQVVLFVGGKQVSVIWDEGESGYDSDMHPSEVLSLIDGRISAYLFMSDREKRREQIAAMRETIKQADISWCIERAERLEAKAKALRNAAQDIVDELADQATGEQA
jgi:hypothetical protein